MAADGVGVAGGGGGGRGGDGAELGEVDVAPVSEPLATLEPLTALQGDLAGGHRFRLELARADRVLGELGGGEGRAAAEDDEGQIVTITLA